MSKIRGDNNRTEVALRKVLWARGFRYRIQAKHIVGRPDIIFPRQGVAVFVDGDYWHGRVLREKGLSGFYERFKTERREFWREKLTKNIRRDDMVTETLQREGWRVMRLWESEVAANVEAAADSIAEILRGGSESNEL